MHIDKITQLNIFLQLDDILLLQRNDNITKLINMLEADNRRAGFKNKIFESQDSKLLIDMFGMIKNELYKDTNEEYQEIN